MNLEKVKTINNLGWREYFAHFYVKWELGNGHRVEGGGLELVSQPLQRRRRAVRLSTKQ